ncbi:DUF4352 domain-containing protein [Halobium palmae]|uniref:DUF4352 domain-containing protein n=1 Tax=Halobium palmae TaxID=1776492 RepID=A0ABD5RXL8_9EURY
MTNETNETNETNRRAFLASAALATAGLAGCTSGDADAGDSGDAKIGGQPTRTLSEKVSASERLAFGETLDLPRVSITLSEPESTATYRWEQDGEERVAEAGEGKQWIVVPVRTENTADRTVRLPLTVNFKGVVGETVYHPGRNKSVDQKYIGGKVPSGGTREGDVMYLVPESTSTAEFRVLYEERRTDGKHQVWWDA